MAPSFWNVVVILVVILLLFGGKKSLSLQKVWAQESKTLKTP